MRFVLKAHGDTIGSVASHLLPQPVVELPSPLAPEGIPDGVPALEELGAVAPLGVLGVGELLLFTFFRVWQIWPSRLRSKKRWPQSR